MRVLSRLLRWAVDPDKLEFIEGDFAELASDPLESGTLAGRWNRLRDIVSVCLRHSRHPIRRWRLGLFTAALGVAVATAVIHAVRSADRTAFTIAASDPAGHFTLRVKDRRVIGATIDGRTVDPARLHQEGNQLVIAGGDRGRDFRIDVTAEGIQWQARLPSPD